MGINRITAEEREALKELEDLFDRGNNYIDEIEAENEKLKTQNARYAEFVGRVNEATMRWNKGGE